VGEGREEGKGRRREGRKEKGRGGREGGAPSGAHVSSFSMSFMHHWTQALVLAFHLFPFSALTPAEV